MQEAEVVQGLSAKAQAGDERALDQIKARLANLYDQYALEFYGDLAQTTEIALVQKLAGDQLLFREGLHRRADALRKELLGPHPAPLEKILVDRIVCCWLNANYSDAIYAQDRTERDWVQDEYIQKRQGRAQSRFIQACKGLAQVRRLLGVNVQINIADKQLNVVS